MYSGEDLTPPKCIFLPSQKVIRSMIKANIKFSKFDDIPRFLLRFGIFADVKFWKFEKTFKDKYTE